jgi:hypothetical protein
MRGAHPCHERRESVGRLLILAMAIVGVLAAAKPESAALKALNHAMPQLADAIPTLITACGAALAAFSQPPKLRRHRRLKSM